MTPAEGEVPFRAAPEERASLTTDLYLEMARRILPIPTAPFHEHLVLAEVRQLADERPELLCRADPFGNLHLRLGTAPPAIILTAHLDHPGLSLAAHDGADWFFHSLGGIPAELTRGAGVLVYGHGGPEPLARGRIMAYLEDGVPGEAEGRPAFRVRLDDPPPPAEAGTVFATWDLPDFEVSGRRLRARACDDLAGVAVALSVIERLRADRGDRVGLLLTRAEETGFGGMLAALEDGHLHRGALYVNIECSSSRSGAPLGQGPVIRVGDRRWVFDAGVTAALTRAAEGLGSRRPGFRYQRRLMDGGTCEATALCRAGLTAGAVALPLESYHNHGGRKLRPEAIALEDAVGLVELLVEVAREPGAAVAAALGDLEGMLDGRRGWQSERLRQTAPGPARPP